VRFHVCAILLFATFFIAGCANPTRDNDSNNPDKPPWHGRLAVRVEADSLHNLAQSFSAEFELTGNALSGELTLYTPFGNTAATLSWSPQTAILLANGDVRYFDSLDNLIKQTVGTEIPVAALFAWLSGDNLIADGWHADLSQQASGKITARRTEPSPLAELRLVLDK
jgi:outer membrane lipoprotein LolB